MNFDLKRLTSAFSFVLPLALTVAGCSGDDKSSAGDTDASSSSSGTTGSETTSASQTSTSGNSAGGTATDGGTMGSSDSVGSTTATTDATSGSTTATTDTTGDTGVVEPGIVESCEEACTKLLECFPEEFPSHQFCIDLCVDESTPPEPNAACEAAAIAFNKCLGAATCDGLISDDFPCAAEELALDEACGGGGQECVGSAGSDPNGTECSISEECPGLYSHELLCDAKFCVCLEDGVETAKCMQKTNVCMDFDPAILEEIGATCCGW